MTSATVSYAGKNQCPITYYMQLLTQLSYHANNASKDSSVILTQIMKAIYPLKEDEEPELMNITERPEVIDLLSALKRVSDTGTFDPTLVAKYNIVRNLWFTRSPSPNRMATKTPIEFASPRGAPSPRSGAHPPIFSQTLRGK